VAEDDEHPDVELASPRPAAHEDNSLGRLLTLADGIFAIAMTLLTLDLRVPDITHATNHQLLEALGHQSASYLSFALSFYVVGSYWIRHRQLMRAVVTIHPVLIRDTLLLLFVVAAMPFFTGLLGRYGSQPIALALYGAANALALLILIALNRDVERLGLAGDAEPNDYAHRWQTWLAFAVFALSIPAAFLLGQHGPWFLILLAIPNRFAWLRRRFTHRRGASAES
jgi:uncharacterized membrane protein